MEPSDTMKGILQGETFQVSSVSVASEVHGVFSDRDLCSTSWGQLTIVYNVMGVFWKTILTSNSKDGLSCLELRILLNVSGENILSKIRKCC